MNTRKGFTLVELLVVIAILAILATVSVVGYTSFINRANESNAMTEAHQIESYINASLMSNEPCKLADNYYVVKVTEDGETSVVLAKDDKGTTAPATTTEIVLGGDFSELKGTVSIGTVDTKSGLVYTLNGVSVLVWEGVVAAE